MSMTRTKFSRTSINLKLRGSTISKKFANYFVELQARTRDLDLRSEFLKSDKRDTTAEGCLLNE
jgi:hypothetical protein